ncbi:MAG: response regulator, partial [Campylobacterota bacterium]|nr:response regulator [Campylobacterota bacterium]
MIDIKELKELASKFSILYVEDESSLQKSVSTYLKKLFNSVDIAKDGEEGLELYKLNKYDLIITDINMPHMNGLEMSKQIK